MQGQYLEITCSYHNAYTNANFKKKNNKKTREPKIEVKATGNEHKQVVRTINKTNCADFKKKNN